MTNPLPRLFLALLLCIALPAAALADTKVAAVNINKLMEGAPQAQAASEDLKKRFAAREQALLEERDQIKKLEERYKRDKDILSKSEREKLEQEIRDRRREFKRKSDEFTEDFSLARNEALNKLQADVYKAIVDVAKRENYDLVVSESVLYASKRVDITDKVLARLKELYQQSH